MGNMDFYLIALLGFVLSYILVFVIMKPYIEMLKNHNINQEVSEYALEEYKKKAHTPIMGGLLFVVLPIIVFLIINAKALNEHSTVIILASYFLFCLVGFGDDILIIVRKDNIGLSPAVKLLLEFFFSIVLFILFKDVLSFCITIPFINLTINMRWFIYLPLIIIMFLGEANAVNFTDGMDGLCAGVSLIGLIGFTVIAFLNKQFNIVIFILCVCGGLIAYLHYNWHPAKIFMGDSGSLALGGLFASLALVLNSEIALLFIGGVFLIEMICVCLQQISVRVFKKRIFSYTPIHYAFVLKGNKETKVVKGFYIAAIIFTVLGVIVGLY